MLEIAGAAARPTGQQPAARGSRSRGSGQSPREADRGASPQTGTTNNYLAVSLPRERVFFCMTVRALRWHYGWIYISVGEALKLVSPFKGDKREVLAFISNVDTAFEVINPENSDVLYKFVLTSVLWHHWIDSCNPLTSSVVELAYLARFTSPSSLRPNLG